MKKLLSVLLLVGCSDVSANYDYEVMGTLRQDPSIPNMWCWIDNYDHTPVNVQRGCFEADRGRLEFFYRYEFDSVLTMIVGPDETFANKSCTFGASAGLLSTIIVGRCNGMAFDFSKRQVNGNIWVYGKMRKN